MDTNPDVAMGDSYSTIFHCTEGGLVCTLRALQGLFSLIMFVFFVKGYLAITKERNNPLSPEDKSMFMLSMVQTLALALYYLLFEEFFVLATIRNLLIWVNINFLQVLGKIYYLKDQKASGHLRMGMHGLRVINFLTWFLFAVGDGSSLENTAFNLGYNCRLMDWTVISAFLLLLTFGEVYFGVMIIDKLDWQLQTYKENKEETESRQSQKQNIILLVGSTFSGALIMFIWDYLAYVGADNDSFCVEVFSGNSFFRKVLCFLLKLISMQVFPCLVYYTTYFKRRNQFLFAQKTITKNDMLQIDLLTDQAYSDLNRSLTSRVDSRGSLFEGVNNIK